MTCGLAEGQWRFMLTTHLHVVTGVRYGVVSIPPYVVHVLSTLFLPSFLSTGQQRRDESKLQSSMHSSYFVFMLHVAPISH